MTPPDKDELEQILDNHAEYYIRQTMKFFQNEGESPALSKNNEGDTAAKQAINRLIAQAVLEALDRVEKHFEADGQASHAYVREYLATLRKELSRKEQTDE